MQKLFFPAITVSSKNVPKKQQTSVLTEQIVPDEVLNKDLLSYFLFLYATLMMKIHPATIKGVCSNLLNVVKI